MAGTGFLDLPAELLLTHVVTRLSTRDKAALQRTSQRTRHILHSPICWLEACHPLLPEQRSHTCFLPTQRLTVSHTCGQVECTLQQHPSPLAWLLRHAPLIRSLALLSPLKLSPHTVPLYCQQVRPRCSLLSLASTGLA